MTFRCALRFEPDKAKGPGYGLILASCPGFSAAPNTLLYMIKDPSNGMSLGPNGWQPGDAHLVPDAVAPSGEILSLSVGPAVVDSLELQAIYQVVLFTDAEHVWQGGLSINRIVYSRDPSLLPDLELAPKAAPSAGREPMPEMETGPAPTSLSFDGKPSSAVPASDFYSPKQPQRGTIQKDTDMANDCYKKALAAGAAEAQQRRDALKEREYWGGEGNPF